MTAPENVPEKEFTYTAEVFVARAELATWAEVGHLVKVGMHAGLDKYGILAGLKSRRKQTVEIITAVLVGLEATEAAEPIIKMMIAQADSANAIRGRNALLGLGVGCAAAILPYLTCKSWQIRQYLVQCLGLYQVPALIPVLEAIQDCDKSAKVRETAVQAMHFTLGQASLAACNLLPSPDEREDRIGVVSEGF